MRRSLCLCHHRQCHQRRSCSSRSSSQSSGRVHRLCPSDPPAPPGVCPLSTHHIRFADSIGQRRHCCCSEQRRRRRRPPPTARCRLAPALPASVSFNAHVKHIWSNAAWAAKVAVNAAVAPGPVLRRSSVRILPVVTRAGGDRRKTTTRRLDLHNSMHTV